jgi:hypothetical protein
MIITYYAKDLARWLSEPAREQASMVDGAVDRMASLSRPAHG